MVLFSVASNNSFQPFPTSRKISTIPGSFHNRFVIDKVPKKLISYSIEGSIIFVFSGIVGCSILSHLLYTFGIVNDRFNVASMFDDDHACIDQFWCIQNGLNVMGCHGSDRVDIKIGNGGSVRFALAKDDNPA
jgi:hypothetical protein